MDPSFSNKQQFSFLTCGRNCPLSKWKPILLKLNIFYFTDIVSHVSLWKPLRPWPEILCTPKRIMWTCLPVEKGKALFMMTCWFLFSSCNFIPAGLFSDWCKSFFFLLLGLAHISLLNMAGQLAAWQPLQGFPLPSWPLDDETLAPSVLTCSVPLCQAPVMETVSVACWHLSVTHKSTIHTCPLAHSTPHT